jgi:outer membrane immunogenic protein
MAGIRSFAAAVAVIGTVCLTTGAFAADLPTKAPTHRPSVAGPVWTGFYAGLNVGYGWGSGSTDFTALDPVNFVPAQMFGTLPTSLNPHIGGFMGGGQIGYNWQLDRTLVGLEADIAYSAMKGEDTYSVGMILANPPMTTTQSSKVTWLGTLRPRLGWLWTPSTLIYVSGGLAYGGVEASTNFNVDIPGTCPAASVFCSTGSLSKVRAGWTVGGGIESLVGTNWSVRVDYLYFDLGRESYPVISTANFGVGGTEVIRAEARFNGHIVRAGLNYHF